MYTLIISIEEKEKIIKFDNPANLSELLIANDIFIDRPCSGKGTCGKCIVKFLSKAPKANKYDIKNISKKKIHKGYRLSCKCVIKKDASIEVAWKESMTIKEYGLPQKNKIFYNDKDLENAYGIAIDLGTTTIVAYLVNLSDGNIIDAQSAVNPQRKYGDNVITRSEYIHTNNNGLKILQSAAKNKINFLIEKLCTNHNIKNISIKRLVLSGNTIMQHIILGINPFQITIAPFTPVFTEQKVISAKEFGINISPTAKCYITNSVSGYVGGDIVSGLIAVEMNTSKKTALLVDIGTNGEIVLSHNGKMYACSVAAGPAFEGEHIKCGVGGIVGAINKAEPKDSRLSYQTIGDATPIGICGSGLLDIVAFLLDASIVDEMGSMDESKCQKSDDEIVYYITDDIYIGQRDIREIQLAKSAVAAGVEVLITRAGISHDEIDNVYLAGGFGSYLNIKSAAKVGLIDKSLEKKCISAGNTAGMGSVKSLLSDKVLESLDTIVQNVEYIELSLDKTFNDLFIENMIF